MGVPRPLIELADQVRRMRAAQMSYFKTRSSAALIAAKNLESQVDRCVASILTPQTLAGLPQTFFPASALNSQLPNDEDTAEIIFCNEDDGA